MSAIDEMLLESEHEREITVDAMRALLEEERKERAELQRQFSELGKKVDDLSKAGIRLALSGGSGSLSVEVLERDASERISSIKVTL